MTRYVTVPTRQGYPEASLFVRMSTPSDPQATEIDKAFPTVVFLPTLWTDSFFFYPQFDDPTFFEHFNLVAIDFRGFGLARSGEMQDEYTWKAAADDIALNISSAHFIAVTFASLAALSFAYKYPDMADSLCLITPPQKEEPFLWTMAFNECRAAMQRALNNGDQDSMDDITIAAWEFSSGSFQSPALIQLRDESLQQARAKMSNGEMRLAAPYMDTLLADRLPSFDKSLGLRIRCPLLILYGTEDGCQSPDEDDTLIRDVNANPHRNARASLQVLKGLPRWMTLTSSNIVNPILTSFLTTPPTAALPLSPETPAFNRSIPRRPSTPRSVSAVVTPMLLRSPLGYGDTKLPASPASAPAAAKGDGQGVVLEDGVRMTIEVTVVSDS